MHKKYVTSIFLRCVNLWQSRFFSQGHMITHIMLMTLGPKICLPYSLGTRLNNTSINYDILTKARLVP